ncbi:Hsp20/alpha crystallin family protein [archaeon]|jgi:HSP20 family molecular chaperone IbpA|nr:Hsp20/alpha crystallin family protein [archaeon]MBT6182953.1 Hsp20/alpha crystallin family protein [archaeon]MBT6606582.1 Hsp20/alpha crystallin family protein [archaeon]MBT7251791.1 Hsp20/alpha crystallin family protein [archaeon]
MNPFGDDPFERLAREFFGGNNSSDDEFIQTEQEVKSLDLIEGKDHVYLIFEFPGFKESEVNVEISRDEIIIVTSRKGLEGEEEYISQKLAATNPIRKKLPSIIKTKNYSKTFRNGVLEIVFDKK